MSISEFRKKKLLYVFNVFFDVNQSGEIDRKDFELAIEKICELRGWPAGNPKNVETHECMFKIWEGLRSKADKDNDGQVSVDEWCNMWDAYAKDPSTVLDWQLSIPQLLILNDCDIDRAGEPEDLKQKCRSVKELDLAQNKLNNWNEIFVILSHMPRVEFVNLSLNHLAGEIPNPVSCRMDNLRNLVLNNTKLEWYSVETLLRYLPSLEELHLSLNEYTHVLIDTITEPSDPIPVPEAPSEEHSANNNNNSSCQQSDRNTLPSQTSASTESNPDACPSPSISRSNSNDSGSSYKTTEAHGGVRKLHLTGNLISEWEEICRIGRVFPKLEVLVLADCPLRSLSSNSEPTISTEADNHPASGDRDSHAFFRNLKLLNLSNAKIQSWEDIDRLARFPSLTNVRVQCWPLWELCDSTEHERRQLLIARLPNISILNGGDIIGAVEREDAERSFIRYYLDKPDDIRPSRYFELVEKHGNLNPLVNIDFKPERKVKVTFKFGEMSEARTVDVHRTVSDLKSRLEKLFNFPASKMRLFYVDQDFKDLQGLEEMKYPHKLLYSYNIRSGDEIIVDKKGSS